MTKALLILIAALITACISGIFGMAGGMIFMGVIASMMGVAEAMVVHGAVQSVSNSYRAHLLKEHIRLDILGYKLTGAIPALAIMSLVAFVPQKGVLFLMLGLLPFLLWFPKGWFEGDIHKPSHAVFCGSLVMSLTLVAGISSPTMDFFYIKTSLTRKEIVATKALTMFVSHLIKILYFGLPLIATAGLSTLPNLWIFLAVIPMVMIGTFTGTRVLHRLSDIGFRSYTKYLLTIIGVVYLIRASTLIG